MAGAGPSDREVDAALAWVWQSGVPLTPLSVEDNHRCALAAVVAWYFRNKDAIDALHQWHERHRAWYAATDPQRPITTHQQFDNAHYELAAAWLQVVKALDAQRAEQEAQP